MLKNKNVQFCTHLEYRQHQQDDGAKSGAIHFRVGGSGGEKILERWLFRGRRANEKNPKTDVQYTIKNSNVSALANKMFVRYRIVS